MRKFLTKKNVVIAVALMTIGILLFLLIQSQSNNPQDEAYEYTDADTGEVVSVQPGVTPEKYNTEGKEPLLLGLSALGDFGSVGLSPGQLPVFKEDLLANGIKVIGDYDETIKVVKIRLNPDSYLLEADLIYKEGAAPILITFDIPNKYVFEYNLTLEGAKVYTSKRILVDGITEEPPDDRL